MMRAMYSGITGLKNFQTVMDIVGNNIANVNTVGFKASRVTFQTALLQTLKSGRAPQDNVGGTNPMQIGLGSQIASIDKLMTQGSFQNTGKKTDLAIQGDGFFILSDGRGYYYTRAGNFILDTNGTLIQASTGYRVQGWKAVQDPESGLRYVDTNQPIGDIVISAGMSMPARATTNMSMEGNLDSTLGPKSFALRLNDSTTNTDYDARFWFVRTASDVGTDPFTEDQRYTMMVDYDKDDVVDAIGYIKINKFGRVVTSGIRDSSPAETGTVTISDNSGDIDLTNTYTGKYLVVLRDSSSDEVVYKEVVSLTGEKKITLSGLDNGDYDWEIRPIDTEKLKEGSVTISGGSGEVSLSNTYTGDYILVLKDSSDTEVYRESVHLENEDSISLDGLTLSDGDYTFELLPPLSSEWTIAGDATVVVPNTGEPRFYESDNPSNFLVLEYESPRYLSAVQVYDTLGNPYQLYIEFVRLGRLYIKSGEIVDPNTPGAEELKNAWAWRAYTSTGELITYKDDTGSDNVNGNKYIGGLINFDESGKLQKYYGIYTGKTNLYVNTQRELRTISFDASLSGDSTVNIDIDLSSVTQFSAPNTANVAWQNGNPQGTLESFAINESGEIIGTFSNGLTDILGKVALAIFNNPAGLQEVGNSLYVPSPNSGLPKIGEPGTGGRGSLIPGALEMSNVDLAEEFTRMIIAQRGFQANARVITTADAILGELVALRR